MNRAQEIQEQIWNVHSFYESVFRFRGPNISGSGETSGTISTKNLEDLFRSKNYVEGREFWWEGPYLLHILDQAIDRDVLDYIETQGGEQQTLPTEY